MAVTSYEEVQTLVVWTILFNVAYNHTDILMWCYIVNYDNKPQVSSDD